jgi:hypothetical protein
MSDLSRWSFTGGQTTVIQGLAVEADLSDWYSRVIAFVLTIAESPDFEVVDNGYRRFPEVLVTEGVTAFFRGNSFGLWSDLPGELILTRATMGSRIANELIRSVEALWITGNGQLTTDNGPLTNDSH